VARTSSKQERLKEYLDVLNVPDLTPEELESITATGSKVHHRAFVRTLCAVSEIRADGTAAGKAHG
jgi:hypothetical protein